MSLKANYFPYTLNFKFEAGTSRGVFHQKDTFFIQVYDPDFPEIIGWGEAAPLRGLSVDDRPDFEDQLAEICLRMHQFDLPKTTEEVLGLVQNLVSHDLPAIRFAFETALLDCLRGGERIIFDNEFSRGESYLPINGLIWMGNPDFMQAQIEQKLAQGFSCIKMKIGALDFEQECSLLASIRKRYPADEITLRLDANGAFSPDDALRKLNKLADFQIHSIEQPISPNQWITLRQLCRESPIPIALDEELIGKSNYSSKQNLLESVQSPYIILKPSLLGGFQATLDWIKIAQKLQIGWWITSALESNIGLNAISQFTANFLVQMPQGLGTGNLFHNNIASPLELEGERLYYRPQKNWEISF